MIRNQKTERRLSSFLIWAAVVVIAVGLAVLIGMTLCRKRAAAEVAAAAVEVQPEQKSIRVAVLRIEPRQIPDMIELPAGLEAFAVADIAAERGGRIVEIPVDQGERVSSGTVMLRLDSRMAEQTLRQAEIQDREAEKEWKRWQELKTTGAVSESDLDAVRKNRELAEVAIEQARISLTQCEVRAPMDGVVDERHVEVGEYMSEAEPVFRVVNVDRLKLAMEVPEQDVSAVKRGEKVVFRVPSAGAREYTGTVSFVASMGNPGSNAFRAEILVEDPDPLLRAGMIAHVSLVRRVLDDAIVVPLSAVVPRKGEHVVFTVEEGHAVRHTVQIRAIMGQDAVLAAGIRAGDVVVIAGQRGLQDGAPVEIQEGSEGR